MGTQTLTALIDKIKAAQVCDGRDKRNPRLCASSQMECIGEERCDDYAVIRINQNYLKQPSTEKQSRATPIIGRYIAANATNETIE